MRRLRHAAAEVRVAAERERPGDVRPVLPRLRSQAVQSGCPVNRQPRILDGGRRPDTPISPRLAEVVLLLAAGYSDAEIGMDLGIAERTVRGHCAVLRAKLGCRRRREIPLAYMCRTGIDPYPRPETA